MMETSTQLNALDVYTPNDIFTKIKPLGKSIQPPTIVLITSVGKFDPVFRRLEIPAIRIGPDIVAEN